MGRTRRVGREGEGRKDREEAAVVRKGVDL